MILWRTIRSLYEYVVLYGGLLFFAVICLAWSLPASLLRHLLPHRIGLRVGRYAIMLGFRTYLAVIRASGLVKLDLTALDVLRKKPSLVIVTNHPALIDVVLVGSRLPNFVCVLKAKLLDNPLLGGGASMAGYVRNDSTAMLVREAGVALREGAQLLIFPEGTRTVREPVNEFKGGFALVAKKAGVPVQTVFLDASSPFLGKHWSFFDKPEFPLRYTARLGKCFMVDADAMTFAADLEKYYCEQMTQKES